MPAFDPQVLGAKCNLCPLNGQTPVPSDVPARTRLVVIGESPGESEQQSGRPFWGPTGLTLERVGRVCGFDRSDLLLGNALSCKAPENISQKDLTKAIECCRPRLIHDLKRSGSKHILALGKAALQATAKPRALIMNWIGGALPAIPEIGEYTVIPALHPAFCLREDGRQWTPVMMTHVQRAWAMATNQLRPWKWPKYELEPNERALEFLTQLSRAREVAFDVETQGADPLTSKIICVGIASKTVGVSLPWEHYYNRKLGDVLGLDEYPLGERLRKMVVQILTSPRIKKVAQNGAFDVASLWHMASLDVRGFAFDTLLAHAVCSPPLRHRLNDIGAIYTHAPRSKDLFRASKDEKGADRFANADPSLLRDYNIKDCFLTIFSKDGLVDHLKRTYRGQEQFEGYMARTAIAAKMRERGVKVDLEKFEGHIKSIRQLRRYPLNQLRLLAFKLEVTSRKLNKQAGMWLKKGRTRRSVTGVPPYVYASKQLKIPIYNPRSHAQVVHFFKELLHAPVLKRSKKTHAPSYGEVQLHELLTDPNPLVSYAASLQLRFRAWDKLLGYFVKRNINGVPVHSGVAHSDHKSYGTRTGRWSGPLLVIPKQGILTIGKRQIKTPSLRDIFVGFDKNWVVETDFCALEAHIIALLASDVEWLETLNNRGDVHVATARIIYGNETFEKGDEKQKKKMRQVGKTSNYALMYGVGDDKLFGNLQNDIPGITMSDVARIRRQATRPAIQSYLRRALSDARRNDFIEEPLSGLRYYFYGNVKETHVYNNPVQMFAASLINRAIIGVDRDLKWGREGIMFQVHDSLVCDGPDPKRLGRILKRNMEQSITLNGHTARFQVDLKFGRSWGPEMRELRI